MIYGAYTGETATRLVCSVLRRTSPQDDALLRPALGSEPKGEHGRAVRRPAHALLQALAIEMLHHRLSEEARDIRCNVPRQDSASPVLQLYPPALRTYVHSGFVQLHQGSWNALRNRPCQGYVPQGESQLAASVLCHAPGYQRLLYAHRQKEAVGYRTRLTPQDGRTPYLQGLASDVERHDGYGLRMLADGSHRHARPSRELRHSRRAVGLGRIGCGEEYAAPGGWAGSAYRQSDLAAVLECLHESLRPVREASTEMQALRQVCRRWYNSQPQQGTPAIPCAGDTAFSQRRARAGAAHGKAGHQRGQQGHRVPWSLHQAVSDISLTAHAGACYPEDIPAGLHEPSQGAAFSQFVSGNIPAYFIIQSASQAVRKSGVPSPRTLRRRTDKAKRQTTVL